MISSRRGVIEWTALLSYLGAVIIAGTQYVAHPWRVSGPSMEPTLLDGDLVLVDRWSFRHRPPRRAELVLLRAPGPGASARVKRVSATYRQAYGLSTLPAWDDLLSADVAWVLGDNPGQSHDSRHHGPVPLESIRGRVFWRYWPLSRFGPID